MVVRVKRHYSPRVIPRIQVIYCYLVGVMLKNDKDSSRVTCYCQIIELKIEISVDLLANRDHALLIREVVVTDVYV